MKGALLALLFASTSSFAQVTTQVVDLPTRNVSERMVVIAPAEPKAAVILLAGGAGRVKIFDNGSIRNEDNFLVRSRSLFAEQGLATLVLDAPGDQAGGMSRTFRESADHVTDLATVVEWARNKWHKPVWLVGTSRGTQSAAHVAVALMNDAREPDGIVLTSSILGRSKRDPGTPVQEQPLGKLKIPVLVVHHEEDPCPICNPSQLREIKLPAQGKIIMEHGGVSTGDPCEAFSHHGYNGIEGTVVADISAFIIGH